MYFFFPVHVLRYFKDKVFTGRAYWGEACEKNYVNRGQKDHLMKQNVVVKNSLSQELYNERYAKFLQMTKFLSFLPGQATKPWAIFGLLIKYFSCVLFDGSLHTGETSQPLVQRIHKARWEIQIYKLSHESKPQWVGGW